MIIEFLKTYAYYILDFFLPVIFVLIYFPFIMSRKTEQVVTRLWAWAMTLSAKNR